MVGYRGADWDYEVIGYRASLAILQIPNNY